MDALEKKLTEVISRASDALEEYGYAKENNTEDYSEVRDQIEMMCEKANDVRRKISVNEVL